MSEMLARTAGIYNFVWWLMACVALWLIYRIYELVKATHYMVAKDFKAARPEVFEDE